MKSSKTSKSTSMLTLIAVAVIVVFAVVCGIFAGPKFKAHIDNKRAEEAATAEDMAVANGEKEPTVSYAARATGISVEDYLAQYGLALGDEITEQTTLDDLTHNMTVSNYVKFAGITDDEGNPDVDSYLAQFSDAVTADTLMKDLNAMSAETALGSEMFNATKEQYGLGDEITGETTLEDFENALVQAQQDAAAAAQSTASPEGEAQATEAPAETPAE